MSQTHSPSVYPRHDIHKFRDLKPKLARDNWVIWKRELLGIVRERGLYANVLGTDILPSTSNQVTTMIGSIPHVGTTPLSQLINEWNDCNNITYNQIMLCVSPELQTAMDITDIASEAWKILVRKFESSDPSKISIVRTRYKNHHMTEGQSVVTYITTMKDFKNQLERMGEKIADSTHTATLLRNVPESWRPISQTIRMITRKPDEIEERLKAHEADLNALEISVQAGTAFAAQTKPTKTPPRPYPQNPPPLRPPYDPRQYPQNPPPLHSQYNPRQYPQNPPPQRPQHNPHAFTQNLPPHHFFNNPYHPHQPHNMQGPIYCNNCSRPGHPASRCYAQGGGLAGQMPWRYNGGINNRNIPIPAARPNQPPPPQYPNPPANKPTTGPPAHLAEETKGFIMIASTIMPPITEHISIAMTQNPQNHTWLIDSAASSHLSGNNSLFLDMKDTPPVTILTASGDTFIANQKGTINIRIASDPSLGLPDVPITLIDVIYTPKLSANLLSVGRMTSTDINVSFDKDSFTLTHQGQTLARGSRADNLYTFSAYAATREPTETGYYSNKPNDITLWHHRLAHAGFSTLEAMRRLNTADGYNPKINQGPTSPCFDCLYGKQTRAPFQKIEKTPDNIGDIIVSDICGPFELSMGGYKYFITWLELATRLGTVDFLKDKECHTITNSFRKFMAWLLRQKNANIKTVRTNNRGEYTGREFNDLCGKLGIIHETTSPHTPEHNGIAERYNRTLQDGALTLQHDSGLTNRFWVSAIHTVNFIKNRILHRRLGLSPYEAFWGKKPNIDWLRTYGCKCWALIPKATRCKGQFKSIEGTFVGYFDDSKAYKVWIAKTHTVMKVRDAIFDESNHIEQITIHSTNEDDLPNLWITEPPITAVISAFPTPDEWINEKEPTDYQDSELTSPPTTEAPDSPKTVTPEPEPDIQTDTNRNNPSQHAPKDFEHGPWLDPNNDSYGRGRRHHALYAATDAIVNGMADLEQVETALITLEQDEPTNYREATRSIDAKKWQESMREEYDTLTGYHTWTLVPRPANTNIVGCRWTYCVKRDNQGQVDKFKSRLVAQGFSQIPRHNFNETYSPTLRFTCIRFILALASRYNLELRHVDIKGAYLNGKLEDHVYMRQPEGFTEKAQSI